MIHFNSKTKSNYSEFDIITEIYRKIFEDSYVRKLFVAFIKHNKQCSLLSFVKNVWEKENKWEKPTTFADCVPDFPILNTREYAFELLDINAIIWFNSIYFNPLTNRIEIKLRFIQDNNPNVVYLDIINDNIVDYDYWKLLNL